MSARGETIAEASSSLSHASDQLRHESVAMALLPHLLLVACVAITFFRPMPVQLGTVLGLTLIAAVWVAWFYSLHPGWHSRSGVMGVYYAGLQLLAAGLVALAPWFGVFALIGYVHAFECLRGIWRYLGVTLTSMVMAVTYMGGLSRIEPREWGLWLAISLVGTVLASVSIFVTERSLQRSQDQQRMLRQLHEANAQLQSAIEENTALNAQLLVQSRQAGVLDERQRVAREIHDTLAQSLAGILTQLQAADQTIGRTEQTRGHLGKAMKLARESLREARQTVHAVASETMLEALLPEAIQQAADSFSEEHMITTTLTTTGDPRPLHPDIEVALLRVVREALNNVAKHAQATRIGLTLSYMEDLITVDVRDDGVGFNTAVRLSAAVPRSTAGTDGGFGLAGMRQRVQRLSGQLVIESQPGEGTAVSASFPAIPAGDHR